MAIRIVVERKSSSRYEPANGAIGASLFWNIAKTNFEGQGGVAYTGIFKGPVAGYRAPGVLNSF